MSAGEEIPDRYDLIEATIRTSRGEMRTKCLVTKSLRYELGGRDHVVLLGRHETRRGEWSKVTRVLMRPWRRLPS